MATQWAKESRDEGWRLEAREHQVEVWHNNQLFTAYKFYPDQFRPWFYPVNSPLGRTVTEELNDYPVMVSNYPLDGPELSAGVLPHLRSLSIAHGDVNGHDVWHEWPDTERQGRIVHLGVTRQESGVDQGLLETRNEWRAVEDGSLLMGDERTFRFFASENGNRVIDLGLVFTAGDKEVALGENHHSLLYARLVHGMSVQKGGRIYTSVSSGDQGETMGKESPWVGYSGAAVPCGPWHGIAIMESPNNPWSSHTWSRDYGFMAMGSFHWMEHTIPAGGSLSLGYRVVVHAGNAAAADIAGEWARYEKEQSG